MWAIFGPLRCDLELNFRTLTLAEFLKELPNEQEHISLEAAELAKVDGVSVNQFIAVAGMSAAISLARSDRTIALSNTILASRLVSHVDPSKA
jgi:hypothetical protein